MMLSPVQLLRLAMSAGFPLGTAVQMVAIALRESRGDPRAYNNKPPDDSYGLWQINMIGNLGPARRKQFGISNNADLFDPQENARAAVLTWAGSTKNLNIAWAIDRGIWQARYQHFMGPAIQAALDAGYSPQVVESAVMVAAGGSESFGLPLPGQSSHNAWLHDLFAENVAFDGIGHHVSSKTA